MSGDETQEPTLRHGDQSVDGWVEYLQQLLNHHLGPTGYEELTVDGDFGNRTHRAVVEFQDRFRLLVDGIVGNQTWSALRAEVPQDPGTDGRTPRTHVERGLEARWFLEHDAAFYFVGADMLVLQAVNTGTAAIDSDNMQLPTVTLTHRGESHLLEALRFSNDSGPAEAGDTFSIVGDGVSALVDQLDPDALDVVATMSAEFGGDVLDTHVTPIDSSPPPVPNIVTDGASLACPWASNLSTLTIPTRLEHDGFAHVTATVVDFQPLLNLGPFGMCSSISNPEVAAASEAAGDVLMPVPCQPVVVAPWIRGSFEVLVEGQPVLTLDSTCLCAWNGPITIVTPGSGPSIQDR